MMRRMKLMILVTLKRFYCHLSNLRSLKICGSELVKFANQPRIRDGLEDIIVKILKSCEKLENSTSLLEIRSWPIGDWQSLSRSKLHQDILQRICGDKSCYFASFKL
jgi:hypothetical protein